MNLFLYLHWMIVEFVFPSVQYLLSTMWLCSCLDQCIMSLSSLPDFVPSPEPSAGVHLTISWPQSWGNVSCPQWCQVAYWQTMWCQGVCRWPPLSHVSVCVADEKLWNPPEHVVILCTAHVTRGYWLMPSILLPNPPFRRLTLLINFIKVAFNELKQ